MPRCRPTTRRPLLTAIIAVAGAVGAAPGAARALNHAAPAPALAGWTGGVALVARFQPADATRPPDPDVAQQAATLLDRASGVARSARLEAARRLVARGTPEARLALLRALQEVGNPAAQYAAAAALAGASGPEPDPAFIDPLFVLISPDAPIDLARPAAAALAEYRQSPVVLARLIDRTADRRGEPSRRAAIEALGAIPEKRSAATLIALLGSEDESRDIRQAAVNALIYMTDATDNGNDVGRWQEWWQRARELDDQAFRAALVASKANRYGPLKRAQDQLVQAAREQLTQMYRALPPERRSAQLLSMLNDDSPAIRAIGAAVVREEKASAAVIPDEVQQRLSEMTGDADPSVRVAVADALRALNYAPAVDAILAQLAVETNPEVKAALARAVAPAQDLRAAPALVSLLADPDRSVARAAALSLRDLGAKLRREAPAPVADSAAAALRSLLRRTRPGPADEPLRAATVDAMAALARPEFNVELQPLLNRREPPTVRRSAIKALAAIGLAGQPEIADSIVPWLEDADATVRLEAANALRDLRRPESIPSLLSRLNERVEPDASVRNAAWEAIEAQLPDAPAQVVANALPQFSRDDEQGRVRRLILLNALADKAAAAGDTQQVAGWREDIGRTHMQESPPAADAAIEAFRLALDDYRRLNSPVGTQRVTEALMQAYLRAGRYDDATRFAAEAIAANGEFAADMGREIKKEADRLVQANAQGAALELIAKSETMSPPLPDSYRRQLSEIEAQVRRRQIDVTNAPPPPSGPRSSGSSPVLPAWWGVG